jgi:hypothetical protein
VAGGQTLQVNLHPPDPINPDPCLVIVEFKDEKGGVLTSELVEIAEGETAVLLFARDKKASGRLLVRPELVKGDVTNPCLLVVTGFEIYDNKTGKTTVAHPPDPIIPGGLGAP